MSRQPILLLATGGTIDKQYFDGANQYQFTETIIGRLLDVARVTHSYKIVELMQKDSLDLTEPDRQLIFKSVSVAAENRIIVTHGTDSMTDTANLLSKVEGKTIVLTGALTPARFSESDAAFNLGMAFGAVQSAPPGVYIAMNGTIFDGRQVVKDRTAGRFVSK